MSFHKSGECSEREGRLLRTVLAASVGVVLSLGPGAVTDTGSQSGMNEGSRDSYQALRKKLTNDEVGSPPTRELPSGRGSFTVSPGQSYESATSTRHGNTGPVRPHLHQPPPPGQAAMDEPQPEPWDGEGVVQERRVGL